jgi:hypothetical protein
MDSGEALEKPNQGHFMALKLRAQWIKLTDNQNLELKPLLKTLPPTTEPLIATTLFAVGLTSQESLAFLAGFATLAIGFKRYLNN